MSSLSNAKAIALIGNHLPRQCGIATFTSDLAGAIAMEAQQRPCWVVAVNDRADGYHYPPQVRFEIQHGRAAEYRLAADVMNMNQVEIACVQHEYGIFGGDFGSYIVELARALHMPVVTTLHTVLREPKPEQRAILRELSRLSDRVIVMAHRAREFLVDIYDVPQDKIEFIPHGIPDLPFFDANYYKDQFGVEGRTVMLSFGLLSPGKGIEYVIEALPEIVAVHPDVVYIVLGATHPHVRKEHGEKYRDSLQARAADLGVERNVIFHNCFLDLPALCEYLGAADIYITPYLGEAQIVSGTLAYAAGAGKAVISTPYWYAQEMLADGRGRLVPFRDARAIAEQVLDLLGNPVEMVAMRKRAYLFCRNMVWQKVAQAYVRVFEEAKRHHRSRPRLEVRRRNGERVGEDRPALDLRHLYAMTDDTGMLQHARFAVPCRKFGYCTDDNARALIVALHARETCDDPRLERRIVTYLSFLDHAFDELTRRFRNFMSYDGQWLERTGSEDSHGRAVWALGMLVRHSVKDWENWLGMKLFKESMDALSTFASPRARAFGMLGLAAYLEKLKVDREARVLYDLLANALQVEFARHASAEWPWLEELVTYDNARIAHALLQAGTMLKRADMVDTGLRALEWLVKVQTVPEGHFAPIGNREWYRRGNEASRFDQQPLEAGSTTEACLMAFRITGNDRWLRSARMCFDWFIGRNDVGAQMWDRTTGGCRDGLGPRGANQNQGAESTLSWLLAQAAYLRHRSDNVAMSNVVTPRSGMVPPRAPSVSSGRT